MPVAGPGWIFLSKLFHQLEESQASAVGVGVAPLEEEPPEEEPPEEEPEEPDEEEEPEEQATGVGVGFLVVQSKS